MSYSAGLRADRQAEFGGYDLSPIDCETLRKAALSGLTFAMLVYQPITAPYQYRLGRSLACRMKERSWLTVSVNGRSFND